MKDLYKTCEDVSPDLIVICVLLKQLERLDKQDLEERKESSFVGFPKDTLNFLKISLSILDSVREISNLELNRNSGKKATLKK